MEPLRRAREPSPEAAEFVRFCYRRRRIGWPEIYDEMCAVIGRGLYHGWTHADLAEHGIGFSLGEMPGLAALASRVISEEETRRGGGQATLARQVPTAATPEPSSPAEPVVPAVEPGIAAVA
jgi:hypothetical protein